MTRVKRFLLAAFAATMVGGGIGDVQATTYYFTNTEQYLWPMSMEQTNGSPFYSVVSYPIDLATSQATAGWVPSNYTYFKLPVYFADKSSWYWIQYYNYVTVRRTSDSSLATCSGNDVSTQHVYSENTQAYATSDTVYFRLINAATDTRSSSCTPGNYCCVETSLASYFYTYSTGNSLIYSNSSSPSIRRLFNYNS